MGLTEYKTLFEGLQDSMPDGWVRALKSALARTESGPPHGDLVHWRKILDELPSLGKTQLYLDRDHVGVDDADSADPVILGRIRDSLMSLHPWRKGPFRIHGVEIDAEWRSNLKWDRLQPAITPLRDRLVLDVGCGNGYYGWRMLGQGARLVLGIDPSRRFVCQFRALEHFLGELPTGVLPLALEDLPPGPGAFDTVFSMGVFYHRRSPFDHLLRLMDCLRPGGELVLETLIVDGAEGQVLVPPGRYAQMRNVWFLPSPGTLLAWLRRCGYRNPRLADLTPTTSDEQRSTEWMRFHSLIDFLDPGQPGLTREGLPAPVRAIVIAEKAD